MTASNTTDIQAPKARLVTTHKSFHVGACDLFAVQPGVDLVDAFNSLGILLETARGTADMLASNYDTVSGETPPNAPWAAVVLIEMAQALNDSIFASYSESLRTPARAELPPTPEAHEAALSAACQAMAATAPARQQKPALTEAQTTAAWQAMAAGNPLMKGYDPRAGQKAAAAGSGGYSSATE